MEKFCYACQKSKPTTEFYKNRSKKDGLCDACKECTKAQVSKYERTNQDKVKVRKKKWRKANSEQVKANGKKYYQDHRDKIIARNEKWRKSNMDRVREAHNIWQKDHRDNINSSRRKWRKGNRELVKATNIRAILKFPEKYRARLAVRNAVNRGELPRVTTLSCVRCGGQAREYHHHHGYEKSHHLDVQPLCVKCHRIADGQSQGQG